MKELIKVFTPNQAVKKSTIAGIVVFQIVLVLLLWIKTSSPLFPKPWEIVKALQNLFMRDEFGADLASSIRLSLEAMVDTVIISLLISYATVLPFFRPLAFLISKFRFLTLVGLSFVFTIITHGGHDLKVWLLVFGMTVFFVTSMVAALKSIDKLEYNHARTLKLNEWEVTREIIVFGRLDVVFEVIRQNFAISWMMLTLVEGISRSEGGIGTMLLNQNKHLNLDSVFAIQIVILAVGITQDYIFGILKVIVCPYSTLSLEKK